MRPVYSMMISSCISMAVFTTQTCLAQCTCWTGLPATPVVTNYSLTTTNIPSADLIFDQMDPSLGDQSCSIVFQYDITAQSVVGARNYASSTALLQTTNPIYSPTGRLEYQFDLHLAANLIGPGISVVKTYNETLGPDSLGAFGQPDDTITYGPIQEFNHLTGSRSFSPNSSYLGTGAVHFSYGFSGGLGTDVGGTNYSQKIITDYEGEFSLTYYYCPAQPLATGIQDFTASRNGSNINVRWASENDQKNTLYEIQVSADGKEFITVGQKQSNPLAAGTTAEYQYQYHLDKIGMDKLYFRLKKTESGGKTGFSAILAADLTKDASENQPLPFHTYPNPVKNNLVFLFKENQTGRYKLELVNTAGQVIQEKSVLLSGTNQITMDLIGHPVRGLYFLRTSDLAKNKSYLSKILID